MTTTTEQNPSAGFAILIKAPNAVRTFVPREGETVRILDKTGKELWSIRVPPPDNNPGIIIYGVQIDLLTEREFGKFCQNTWNRGSAHEPASAAPEPPANAS